MIRVTFTRVKPEQETRLRDWLAELTVRQAEVRQTFALEGTRQEQAYILPTSDGPVLVYVMEADDVERARRAYGESSLPIDEEHRAVLAEVLGHKLKLDPLFDCAVPPEGAATPAAR